MDLNLHLEPRYTYLYALVTGDFELKHAKAVSQRVLDASVQHGLSKILVDCRELQGVPTTMERWDYAIFMAERYHKFRFEGQLHGLRLVIVGSPPFIDPSRLGETVMVNRGLDAKAVVEFDEVLRWLGVDDAHRRE